MAKHVADRPRKATPARPARYVEIARRAGPAPGDGPLFRRPRPTDEALRLQAFVAAARAQLAAEGRHLADGPRLDAQGRAAQYLEIARREGLHPAVQAMHSRSRDSAEVARLRAFLREAGAEAGATGRHVADAPRTGTPDRPARYVEMARRQGIHPTVRALRNRRGDSTAMIRLREFLRIARGDTA